MAGGHEWSPSGSTFRCKGAPSAIGATTDTFVGFCGGELCLIALNVLFDESDPRADKAFLKIANTLQVRYGTPRVLEPRIPQHCKDRIVTCAADEDARSRPSVPASWRPRPRRRSRCDPCSAGGCAARGPWGCRSGPAGCWRS